MRGKTPRDIDSTSLIDVITPVAGGTPEDPSPEVRGESMVAQLVRHVAADWSRRYVGLLALVVVVGLIVTLTPSRPPEMANAGQAGGWSSYQPDGSEAGTARLDEPAPVALAPITVPSQSPTTAPQRRSGAPVVQPVDTAPTDIALPAVSPVSAPLASPLPDEPFPDFATCLSGETSGSTQLPIAQLLRVAGPILPLIGPITPLVLGLLPLLGPFLPKILPVIPMIQPFLDQISPAVESATPSIVEFENRLLAPLMPYIDKQMPKLLDAERELVAALEPQARRLAGLKESDCVGVTVATAGEASAKLVSGDLALKPSPTPVEGTAERVVTMVLRWSDPLELRERIREVAALDREDVMVRLVIDKASEGKSTNATVRTWVSQTVRALPMVSAWEVGLPASGNTSNVDAVQGLLSGAVTAAVQNRRVGQLVGIGLPSDLAGSSVVWDRLHDALSEDARSRVNFVGMSVPPVSLDAGQRALLIEAFRSAVSGFRSGPVPITVSVATSSADIAAIAREWASSAAELPTWLLSFELADKPSAESMHAAMLALPALHRQVKP